MLPGHNKQVAAMKQAGVDSGWVVESVRVHNKRMPKQIILIPIVFIIFLLGWNQTKRRKRMELAEAS